MFKKNNLILCFLLSQLLFLTGELWASANSCTQFFENKKKEEYSIELSDYQLLIYELLNTEKNLKSLDSSDNIRAVKEYQRKEENFIFTTKKLLNKNGIKANYDLKKQEFEILPISGLSSLNDVAKNLYEFYKTKVIFSFREVAEDRVLASFEPPRESDISVINLPFMSLFTPINHGVVHEITHAEITHLNSQMKALDFKVDLGYKYYGMPEIRDKNREYKEFPAQELATIADEVFALSKFGFRVREIHDYEHRVNKQFDILTTINEAVRIGRQNHETLNEVQFLYKYYLQEFIKTKKFSTYTDDERNDQVIIANIETGASFFIYPKSTGLMVKMTDHLTGAYAVVELSGEKFVNEYYKMKKLNVRDFRYRTYLLKALMMGGEKLSRMQSLAEKLDVKYSEIQQAISSGSSKKVVEVYTSGLSVFEITADFFKSSLESEHPTVNSYPDLNLVIQN